MGGAAKPLFEVGGRTLLAAAVTAVTDAGARPITVAADVLDPGLDVAWVREDPPFGGPVAGAVAVLEAWAARGRCRSGRSCSRATCPARLTPSRGSPPTCRSCPRDSDGICLGDSSSRPQWLTGIYRHRALLGARRRRCPIAGATRPVRALVEDLAITVVAVPGDLTDDIDTWEDLERARTRAATPTEERS